ncbi:MAG: tripartite tricarboxylate transporter TctB family protein [Sutterellaceae bacterium]|nr:tripartite tricarboxylate transporter TctB family protein [Burkholderiaceae bacterium]MDW8429934.1 tripartite tricarboxylate transporter TctB family protein [Sutterellaceae bacterium]
MRIRHQKDFWSGVMFFVLGLAFAGFAQEYDMGTAQRMGPAYFPTMLGGLLALLGLIIGIKGLAHEAPDGAVEKFHFGPLLIVLGAVALFGLLLRPLGLVLSLAVLIAVSAYASHEFRVREVIPLAIFLIVLVLAVFIWGLGLVIPIWPAFFSNN